MQAGFASSRPASSDPASPNGASSHGASSSWTSPEWPTSDRSVALELDARDPLRALRSEFAFPSREAIARTGAGGLAAGPSHDATSVVYLTGNSLGLMPKQARADVLQELDDWANLGVEGHFHARHPWYPYHEPFREPLARLVGATPREVVAMNGLTTNLHLLMCSFYRPTRERHAIVIEDSAFPSDSYAVASQARLHAPAAGFDPDRAMIRLRPREGERTLRTSDIVEAIEREGPRIALVMLGGVNYLSGQWFDMPVITRAGRNVGARVGWDLAHAIGNVPMQLHAWDVDFAAWCSYKYLNAGPGAVAGAFVHERHCTGAEAKRLPRMAGWWGNDPATRFAMTPEFVPVESADAWSLSNPPVLSLAPLRASLELFDRAGMSNLRQKSLKLGSYFRFLLKQRAPGVRCVTPDEPEARGCQLSLEFTGPANDARGAHQRLLAQGIVTDFREPNIIRAAPVPLYNSFSDVWDAVQAIAAP
ncbi:MAG: kynureninase [Planctomycetota bacterium]|nr:kynureninase [Planctomycetota bacterium]